MLSLSGTLITTADHTVARNACRVGFILVIDRQAFQPHQPRIDKMQNLNRLNVPDVIATLKTGAEVNIGAANEADRKRLRRACSSAGF